LGKNSAVVVTTTIDDLYQKSGLGPVVVKLDVEGAESAALRGATRALRSALFIYEDHGADRHHSATRSFLDAGLSVMFIDDHGNPPLAVPYIDDLDALKSDRTYGYNLFGYHPDGCWNSWDPAKRQTRSPDN